MLHILCTYNRIIITIAYYKVLFIYTLLTITMFKQATQFINVLLRACECVHARYFQTNPFLPVPSDSAADSAMHQEKVHILDISLSTCPTMYPALVMATAYSSCSLVPSCATCSVSSITGVQTAL